MGKSIGTAPVKPICRTAGLWGPGSRQPRSRQVTLLCRILGHYRSRKKVHFNNNARRWQSYCIFCSELMTRQETSDRWHAPYAW